MPSLFSRYPAIHWPSSHTSATEVWSCIQVSEIIISVTHTLHTKDTFNWQLPTNTWAHHLAGCKAHGVHLSKTSYFVCGTSVSLCLLIQRTSKHLGHNSSAYFCGQAIKHACSFSSFQLAQRTSRVKFGHGKQKTHLPTGQVHLNLSLALPCPALLMQFTVLTSHCYVPAEGYTIHLFFHVNKISGTISLNTNGIRIKPLEKTAIKTWDGTWE